MRKAKKITIIFSVVFMATFIFVPHSSALEMEPSAITANVYSVFFLTKYGPKTDIMTFSAGGAITMATSMGNGTYVDLGGPFIGYFFGFDVSISSGTALITMAGMATDPFLVGTGILYVADTNDISVFTFMGRSLL